MIPASLSTRVSQLDPHVRRVLDFLQRRIGADLSDINVVQVTGRPKSATSIFQKLQTGRYASINELQDLAALTVVVLYRREVRTALDIVKGSGLAIVDEPKRVVEATDFRYREPKLLLKPPDDFVERNPELAGIVAEVQFTTAIQHALDMTTHDFDYKGRAYSWSNFRLVAQLRGLLELVDNMIDDIEGVAIASHETIEPPSKLIYASEILDVLTTQFEDEYLPADRRRLADTVAAWTVASGIGAAELKAALDLHADLREARSLDPASAILGVLLRVHGADLVATFEGKFAISTELESLCPETSIVSEDRRVSLN